MTDDNSGWQMTMPDGRWGPTKFPNLLKVAGPFCFSATWPRTMLRQPRRGSIQARIPRVGTSPHVASPVRPALPAGAKSLRVDGMNPPKRTASRRPIPWPPLPNPSARRVEHDARSWGDPSAAERRAAVLRRARATVRCDARAQEGRAGRRRGLHALTGPTRAAQPPAYPAGYLVGEL